jgi:hypothetical protein
MINVSLMLFQMQGKRCLRVWFRGTKLHTLTVVSLDSRGEGGFEIIYWFIVKSY